MKRVDHRIFLTAITLGGFALRVVRLDFQPLWWDEGYSIFFATRDFPTMLERTAVDIHPPLYYALLQIWMALAGKSEVAVRLLSVAIGVAAIPLIYILAIKLFANQRVAFIAAFLLTLSPLNIYYSQEVRMYGLVTLLGLASVYSFVQLLRMPVGKPETAAVVVVYVIITAAALYTQYYAAFLVAFEILVALLLLVRHSSLVTRHSLAHWIAAWVAIAALYLPWVVYAGGKLYTYVTSKVAIEKYVPLDPLTFLAQHLAAFSAGHLSDWTWLAWGSVVLVAFALLGTASTLRHGDKEIRANGNALQISLSPGLVVCLYLFVPLALGYVVNLVYPFHPIRNERLLLLAAPAFLMLVALGIEILWNRRAWLGALGLVIAAALSAASLYDFYSVPRYPNDDYRPLIAEMQQLAQPGDTFFAIYPWQIGYLEMYYAGAPLDVVETPNDAWVNDPAQMQHELDALMAKPAPQSARGLRPRVWLPALQTLGHILEDALDANLRPRTYSVIDTWFGTTRLELYAREDDPPRSDRVLPVAASKVAGDLKSWGVSENPIAAGQDILPVWFDWGSVAGSNSKISLRLVDSGGNLWAQDDRAIETGIQRIGFAVPTGTPPGKYDLRLTIYSDQAEGTQSDSLARVHVVTPPQVNLAAVPRRVDIDIDNGIRLVGYDLSANTVHPGEPTAIALYWQTTRVPNANYAVELQIQDDRGNVYGRSQAAPALGIYPTISWQPDELVRDPQSFMLRADTPDGDYHIVAALIDTSSNARTRPAEVGNITVRNRTHYFGAPVPAQTLNARFGNLARLVGYDLSNNGKDVRLVLYWQVLASASNSYKVFVHIIDANGNIIAQGDQIPGTAALPTTSWVKSEYLADLHEISIPSNAPGEYQIRIGIYDPKTGERLSIFDASEQNVGDYIQLPTRITVN